jgi:universal stress protein E
MRHIERILVTVKNPDAGWSAAIVKATQLARATGAHIDLFFSADTLLESEHCAPYREMLESLALQVQEHGVSASAVARAGYPAHESILRHAESTCADLIVTDCCTGLHIMPSLFQLTDWELARFSPVPVLIVKRQRLYRRPTVLAAVDPTHAYSKPLQLDAQILDCGSSISESLRGTLHAVHAYVPTPFAEDAYTCLAAGTALRADAIAAADAGIAFGKVLRSAQIPAEHRHLVAGHPADVSRQVVKETGADIVAMGSMARTGLRRLLIGNTAEQLLYRLPCDLLLVKPAGIANMRQGRSQEDGATQTRLRPARLV